MKAAYVRHRSFVPLSILVLTAMCLFRSARILLEPDPTWAATTGRRLQSLRSSSTSTTAAAAAASGSPGMPDRPRALPAELFAMGEGLTSNGGIDPEKLPEKPASEDDIHVVFNTDCSPQQDWQSLLLFHSAESAGQQGRVTRIAAGCSPEEQEALRNLHKTLPPQHRVHFTPDFTLYTTGGEPYAASNTPYGLSHFLEHAVPPVREASIAVVESDTIFLRPLKPHWARGTESFMPGHPSVQVRGRDAEWVTRGHPVAQSRGYGGSWASWPQLRNFIPPDSPVLTMEESEAATFYAAGPPLIAHTTDWLHLSEQWSIFTKALLLVEREPALIERESWSLAAASLRLPQTIFSSLMASDPKNGDGEGWEIVDGLPAEEVCMSPEEFRLLHGSVTEDNVALPIPATLHYSEMYRQGLYMFGKDEPSLQHIFRCDGPLLLEPPQHITTMRVAVAPGTVEEVTEREARRQTFALCMATKALNEALLAYRERACPRQDSSDSPPPMHLTDLQPEELAGRSRWEALNAI